MKIKTESDLDKSLYPVKIMVKINLWPEPKHQTNKRYKQSDSEDETEEKNTKH